MDHILAEDEILEGLGEQLEAAWKFEREATAEFLNEATISEDDLNAISDETGRVVQKIISLKAATLQGLRVKARAFQWCYADEEARLSGSTTDIRLVQSILDDLFAVAPRELASRQTHRDAWQGALFGQSSAPHNYVT
ncbi:MAG: hypothetical protein WC807_21210 [Hyphomicrobium sp.]|jgi:hypothetical protein